MTVGKTKTIFGRMAGKGAVMVLFVNSRITAPISGIDGGGGKYGSFDDNWLNSHLIRLC